MLSRKRKKHNVRLRITKGVKNQGKARKCLLVPLKQMIILIEGQKQKTISSNLIKLS